MSQDLSHGMVQFPRRAPMPFQRTDESAACERVAQAPPEIAHPARHSSLPRLGSRSRMIVVISIRIAEF
ncbi:hypothetical protein [Maritimibacter sp. UBA3975]|uniref:hypothetical protein n=1 Tax=Maritimibacter sp. UBA3975 TaxID=1946833 RepID=UPI000C0A4999|nr:hypothetical protein [Maritimibacter sp. UBA3975]MAM61213.1 hypothetical protein [Maritimibacter sp.]|tara:strand:+ start:14790 stop:14996 length:207 start_codon:yes stop_codon:yes gene_type:complete